MTRPLEARHIAATLAALLASASPAAAQQPPAKTPAAQPTPNQATPTEAQQQEAIAFINREASEKGVFSFDYGVPSSPALKLLGQPEDKITVVNGLKPFILQLPRLLGGGEGGQSLGLDVAPAWLLGDRSTRTYNAYRDGGKLYRILHRTHLGAALYEGVADDDSTKAKPSRVTLGFSTSLLDSSDVLMARGYRTGAGGIKVPIGWQPCLDRNNAGVAQFFADYDMKPDAPKAALLEKIHTRLPRHRQLKAKVDAETATRQEVDEYAALTEELTALQAQIDEIPNRDSAVFHQAFAKTEVAKELARCPKEANVVAQYGASLNIGAGALWDGTPGKLKGFSSSGFVGWVSFRHPIGSNFVLDDKDKKDPKLKPTSYWMIGFSARASVDELVATGIEATPQVKADVFDGWVGLERLTPSSRLGLQLGYQMRDTDGTLTDFDRKRWRYFGSYSQRLGGEKSGIWLQIGYGHVRSSDDDDEALAVSLIFAPPSPANLFGTK